MMFSSNQSFTICGETDEALAKVLQLAIELDGGSMYEAYYDDDNGLCFCSIGVDKADSDEEDEGITNYAPAPTVNSLVEHIKQWLASLSAERKAAMAGPMPNIDGSVYLGWEVFCPKWYGKDALADYKWNVTLAVRPHWICYHK